MCHKISLDIVFSLDIVTDIKKKILILSKKPQVMSKSLFTDKTGTQRGWVTSPNQSVRTVHETYFCDFKSSLFFFNDTMLLFYDLTKPLLCFCLSIITLKELNTIERKLNLGVGRPVCPAPLCKCSVILGKLQLI